MNRAFIYRAARRLYAWARRDLPNRPEANGEYWLVSEALAHAADGAVFMDIGANKGNWTNQVLINAQTRDVSVKIVAFEPSSETRQMLAARFSGNECVDIRATGMSDQVGKAMMFLNGIGAGTNSLHPSSGQRQEEINITTLDAFLSSEHIAHVAFAKIDVEGFDALVLQGASNALASGVFDLVQFEYNWRWVLNSRNLRSVFGLIGNAPYRFGKLAGNRILFFDKWHFEMDRFFENNYVLVRRGSPYEVLGTPAHYDSSNSLRY